MRSLSIFQVVLLAFFGASAVGGILIFALVVGGGGGGSGPITIWGTLDPSAFTAVLRQLSEEEPRLGQVSYVQKDPTTYERDLTDALASGTGPDLFLLRQDYAFRNANKVVPVPYAFLSESQFMNTFIDASEAYLTPEGSLGIPIVSDPLVLYWNRDLLARSGFAQPPRFWDELNEMAQKIVTKNEAGVISDAAIAFGEYRNVNNAKDIVAMLIMQAGGSVTAKDNTGRLVPALSARTGVSTSQASEAALRFFTEFADPSKTDYSWNRSMRGAREAFAAGDLGLYLGYASEQGLISRTNPNLNFAAAPIPQIRGASTYVGAARVYALAATRISRAPQDAITIASLLGSTEASRALSLALGIPSARREVLAVPAQEGNADLFNKQTIIARSWIDPDPERTDAIFRDMIEGITSGSSRVSEAIQRADQQLAEIIGQ